MLLSFYLLLTLAMAGLAVDQFRRRDYFLGVMALCWCAWYASFVMSLLFG